eukprot:TRINITY_DN12251_c0_g1_i1.p1 TRINITY_DN12251_c0_g1~~TRINITY_DN12251_c0_g1_i1.p1  ORF type:complete len:693 (+),score=101.58 TRINITY_DN12251_c0_g1_i1:96-2081(+)
MGTQNNFFSRKSSMPDKRKRPPLPQLVSQESSPSAGLYFKPGSTRGSVAKIGNSSFMTKASPVSKGTHFRFQSIPDLQKIPSSQRDDLDPGSKSRSRPLSILYSQQSLYTKQTIEPYQQRFATLTQAEEKSSKQDLTPLEYLERCKSSEDFLWYIRRSPYAEHFGLLAERIESDPSFTPAKISEYIMSKSRINPAETLTEQEVVLTEEDESKKITTFAHTPCYFRIKVSEKVGILKILLRPHPREVVFSKLSIYTSFSVERPSALRNDFSFDRQLVLRVPLSTSKANFLYACIVSDIAVAFFVRFRTEESTIKSRHMLRKLGELASSGRDEGQPRSMFPTEDTEYQWQRSTMVIPRVAVNYLEPGQIKERTRKAKEKRIQAQKLADFRREMLEEDRREALFFEVNKNGVLKQLRRYEERYLVEVNIRNELIRRWIGIISFVSAINGTHFFYRLRKEQLLRQAEAIFIISRAYFKYKRRRATRGETWSDRVFFDIKTMFNFQAAGILTVREIKIKSIIVSILKTYAQKQFLLVSCRATVMRIRRIQERWRDFKQRKDAFQDMMELHFDKTFFSICADLRSREGEAKATSKGGTPRNRKISILISDKGFKQRVIQLYLDQCRVQYHEKMIAYRESLMQMRSEKRKRFEYAKFFMIQVLSLIHI